MSAEAAGAAAGGKVLIGAGGVAGAVTLAAVVVMLVKQPRAPREWALALISTVASSLGGGAAIVMHFGLMKWAQVADPTEAWVGLVALLGIVFACGLPGWVLVRIAFNTMAKYQDKTIEDLAADAGRIKL